MKGVEQLEVRRVVEGLLGRKTVLKAIPALRGCKLANFGVMSGVFARSGAHKGLGNFVERPEVKSSILEW